MVHFAFPHAWQLLRCKLFPDVDLSLFYTQKSFHHNDVKNTKHNRKRQKKNDQNLKPLASLPYKMLTMINMRERWQIWVRGTRPSMCIDVEKCQLPTGRARRGASGLLRCCQKTNISPPLDHQEALTSAFLATWTQNPLTSPPGARQHVQQWMFKRKKGKKKSAFAKPTDQMRSWHGFSQSLSSPRAQLAFLFSWFLQAFQRFVYLELNMWFAWSCHLVINGACSFRFSWTFKQVKHESPDAFQVSELEKVVKLVSLANKTTQKSKTCAHELSKWLFDAIKRERKGSTAGKVAAKLSLRAFKVLLGFL